MSLFLAPMPARVADNNAQTPESYTLNPTARGSEREAQIDAFISEESDKFVFLLSTKRLGLTLRKTSVV